MKLYPLLCVAAALAAACSAATPPVSGDLSSGTSTKPSSSSSGGVAIGNDDDTDASTDASTDAPTDAGAPADADAAPEPPPPSLCDTALTLGTSTGVPGVSGTTLRFAAISKDELTIAWLANGTLMIADRDDKNGTFGAGQTLSSAVAPDGVALTSDGLHLLAIGSDRKSFVPFERDVHGDAFATGDTTAYTNLVDDLAAGETIGDVTFIHDDEAILYSLFGRTDDTVHYATRVSAFADFDPEGPLGYPELRAQNGLYRHVSGVEDDFQTIFYWDDVSSTEKLAHTNGTATVISTTDLGAAHPWAEATGSCDRVYFGNAGLFFATAK